MSTTTGNSKQIRVTDPNGNVWVMTMVDAEAREAIESAKSVEFDDDYFTAEVSQDETELNIGLNGVPLGVDTDTPLEIVQDDENGIAFGSKANFATAIAPEYDKLSTYDSGERVTHLGKYWKAKDDIVLAEDWTPAHWEEIDVDSQLISPETSIYGDYIADESGQAVLGESGEQIISEGAAVLYDTFKGVKFGAARAVADQDGNVFGDTYARKLLPATKAFAASVTVDNNRVTSITGVTGSVAIDITVAPGECANTAVELTTGSSVTADSSVTVTVNGVAAGRAAATDGKISASKKYQVTCVGTCWTMAEFG